MLRLDSRLGPDANLQPFLFLCAEHHHALLAPFLGDDGGYHPIPLYGDGTVISVSDLDILNQIAETTQAVIKWEQGDVLILDNHAALHSRVPWEGERKILASLWDGEKFPDKQNPWGEKQWEAFNSEGKLRSEV
jgi:hypothetical protein